MTFVSIDDAGCQLHFVKTSYDIKYDLKWQLSPLCPQLALANFFEDGGDDDIATLPQPETGSVSRSTGPR